jgi:heme-degrading monooxygenase HmoA
VAVIFLHTVVTTAIQTIFPSRNIYFSDVVPARTTAQFPNPTYDPSRPAEKPLFGPNPASEQVVCFHIGMRYNHPLGPAAPGAKEMGQHIMKMFGAVHERAEEFGFLGMTSWRGGERDRLNTSLSVMYFRTLEGLHAFAHDKVHREGWDWYNKFTRETGYKHLGIYHETFVAPAGQWETVFDNMPPTLLGAANFPVRNEQTGEEEFVSPLVDGTVTKLRSQYGRMGKTSGGYQL